MVEMARWRPVVMVTVKVVLLLVLLSEVVHGAVLSEVKTAESGLAVKSRTKRATANNEEDTNNTDEDGNPGGAVYTRWGRKDCPDDAHCLYNGVTVGGCNYPMEIMCLANHPSFYPNETTWNEHQMTGPEWFLGQNLCGVEYGFTQLGIQPEENAPCAVCQVERTTQIVIPGRSICVDGWRLEYQGYLMVNQENMGVTPICVDVNPETDRSGAGHSGQVVTLQHAVPACESIPCGPYASDKAITCVVCSK